MGIKAEIKNEFNIGIIFLKKLIFLAFHIDLLK